MTRIKVTFEQVNALGLTAPRDLLGRVTYHPGGGELDVPDADEADVKAALADPDLAANAATRRKAVEVTGARATAYSRAYDKLDHGDTVRAVGYVLDAILAQLDVAAINGELTLTDEMKTVLAQRNTVKAGNPF